MIDKRMTQKTYFELLNQPQAFAVDLSSLEAVKTALLSRLHPDRFVTASALEKRIAQQMSVQVNEAYRVLSDDLLRAQYLCKLKGYDVNEHRSMPADFLMRQMQWHEALDNCEQKGDESLRSRLCEEVELERDQLIKRAALAFDETHDDKAAFEATRELMFVNKLLAQIQH